MFNTYVSGRFHKFLMLIFYFPQRYSSSEIISLRDKHLDRILKDNTIHRDSSAWLLYATKLILTRVSSMTNPRNRTNVEEVLRHEVIFGCILASILLSIDRWRGD